MTNPTPLSPLIEKIEAAEEGSGDLSRELLDAVDPGLQTRGWMNQTTSLDAIVTLIEHHFPRAYWKLTERGRAVAVVVSMEDFAGYGDASTPALALCSAFLKSLQSERGEG